jgi:DNA primase catalytic core
VALSVEFLDQLRSRTTLSALIGKQVKLTRKGGEAKGCCPFHHEKTPSFTVSDDKGFYHCFGCGAHGDAIRWLTDGQGMGFIDAVKELAAAAGIDLPAPSPQAQQRDDSIASAASVLDQAAAWYHQQLLADAQVLAALADRGVGTLAIDKFDLGFAPPKRGVAACGVEPEMLEQAGLLVKDERSGAFRDRFRSRVMIPIHDARGRAVGFAGRLHGNAGSDVAKYINSPDSPHFDKGDLLFNLHRAAPAARQARRLIIVEGQFDVIGLDAIGIGETVAPMGTAVTEKQLERAWRVANCPVLLFDGDAAGRKAALRAAERAMPHVGPGKSLAIAQLPDGEDPDSLARSGGRDAVEAVIADARPLSDWLFDTLLAAA